MSPRNFIGLIALSTLMVWTGCAKRAPLPKETAPPPLQPAPERLEGHLLGIWENAERGRGVKRIIFKSDGTLTFKGGLEFFNPAQWELDSARHELKLTFPQADDDKLAIFRMYIGDGVKAFDTPTKRATYAFDAHTQELNFGGWSYSKPEALSAPAPAPAEQEPVFR